MPKHAYLIIAHGNIEALKNLIVSIDDPRNEIYLHIDKKWKNFREEEIVSCAKVSPLHIFSRYDVRWGSVKLVETELYLLSQAVNGGGWRVCHLLSGQDICLKTQDEIHSFFDANEGKEFLTYCGEDWNERARDRVRYYYPTCGRSRVKTFFAKAYRRFQKLFRVDRCKKDKVVWVGGSEWASLTFEFGKFLTDRTDDILHRLRGTFCADELYKHTIAYNSSFKENVYLLKIPQKNDDTDADMNLANMRRIDWVRGSPYLFTEENLSELLASPCMFARKIDAALGRTLNAVKRSAPQGGPDEKQPQV